MISHDGVIRKFLLLYQFFLEHMARYFHPKAPAVIERLTAMESWNWKTVGILHLKNRELTIFYASFKTAIDILAFSSLCCQNRIIYMFFYSKSIHKHWLNHEIVTRGIKEVCFQKKKRHMQIVFSTFATFQQMTEAIINHLTWLCKQRYLTSLLTCYLPRLSPW